MASNGSGKKSGDTAINNTVWEKFSSLIKIFEKISLISAKWDPQRARLCKHFSINMEKKVGLYWEQKVRCVGQIIFTDVHNVYIKSNIACKMSIVIWNNWQGNIFRHRQMELEFWHL